MSVESLLTLIARHAHIAYGAVFFISFSESLAFVGLLMPGATLMFGAGAVVAGGGLLLKPTLIAAAAGAVAGDGLSYWLGRHYQDRLKGHWPFRSHPEMLGRGETFFRQHGGKSVLFGRFIGPLRPIIPIVAGMLGMPPGRFVLVNGLSAIGWALAYTLPGVFFGASLALAGAVSIRLTVLILLVGGVSWALAWICKRFIRLVGQGIPRWFASLENWLAAETSVHGVKLALKRFVSFLFFRQKGEEFLLAFLFLVFILAGWGFLGILEDLVAGDPLVLADQAVYHFFQTLRTPWIDHVFVLMTELGDTAINVSVAGAVLVLFIVKRCYRTAGYWLLTLVGGACLLWLLKWTLHVPGPVALYHGASTFGFPSGHTTMNVILYGFLAILIGRGLPNALRWGFYAVIFMVSFSIAFSRLYLGIQWLSDVLGGVLLAAVWTSLLGIAYLKGKPERIPRRLVALVTMLVLVTLGAWHTAYRHSRDFSFYAPRQATQTMTLRKWLADGWKALPAWRIDIGGEREQPLVIQWAGSPQDLAGFLVARGWHRAPTFNVKTFLNMFSPNSTIQDLPVFPHLHDGRFEKVLLVRNAGRERWVFRLWPTDFVLAEKNAPLWVGTAQTQGKRLLADLLTIAKDSGSYLQPLESLFQTLHEQYGVREVYRTGLGIRQNQKADDLLWDGRVLLAPDPVR